MIPQLTHRQSQVLNLLAQGLSNLEIGAQLGIGERAVNAILGRTRSRLGLRSRSALAGAFTNIEMVGSMQLQPRLLQYLFRRAPIAIALLRGPQHVFVLVNETGMRMVHRRELVGRSFAEIFPELMGQGSVDRLDRVYTTGEPLIAHQQLARIDVGGRFNDYYFDYVIEPTRDENDTIDGLACFTLDVTPLVAARRRIEELSEVQAAILGHVSSGVLALDRDGSVLFANDAATRVLGPLWEGPLSPQQFIDRYQVRDADSGRPIASDGGVVPRAFDGERVPPIERLVRRIDIGRDVRVRITGVPLHTPARRVRAVLLILDPHSRGHRPTGL